MGMPIADWPYVPKLARVIPGGIDIFHRHDRFFAPNSHERMDHS